MYEQEKLDTINISMKFEIKKKNKLIASSTV